MGLFGKAMNLGAVFSSGQVTDVINIQQLQQIGLNATQIQQLGSLFSGLPSKIMLDTFGTTDYFLPSDQKSQDRALNSPGA